jgi:hypothetical protein
MAHKEKRGYEILYVNLLGKKKHIGCWGCCLIIDDFSPLFCFYWISNKKKRRLFLFRCVIYGLLPPLHSTLYRDVCLFHSRTTESPQWNEKNIKKNKTGMRKKAVHAKIDSLAPFDREKPTKFVLFFRFWLFIFHYNWEVEKKIGNLIAATILRVDDVRHIVWPVLF